MPGLPQTEAAMEHFLYPHVRNIAEATVATRACSTMAYRWCEQVPVEAKLGTPSECNTNSSGLKGTQLGGRRWVLGASFSP